MAAPTALYALLGNSSGAEVYVDYLNGNDTTGAGTLASPWKTIEKGRDQVATNGIINLRYAGGTIYRPASGERWVIQKNGASAADPITLRTYPGDSPDYTTGANMARLQGSILAGGTSTRYGGWRFFDLDIVNTVGVARGAAGVEGIKIECFRDVEVARCHIHQTVETAILVTGSVSDATRVENWHVHHCKIYRVGTTHAASGNNHDHGIYIGGETVGGAHAGQAFNNLIYDCHYGSCIQFYPLATGNIAAYNTLYDTSELNAPDGAALGNPVMLFYGTTGGTGLGLTDNVVSSNIIVRSRQDATTRLAVETGGNVGSGNRLHKNLPNEITDNALWGSSAMWVNNATRAADNLTEQSPLWVDVVAGGAKDFRLQAGSPAINAGESAYMPSTDFVGAARVTPDIGAYAATASGGPVTQRMGLLGVGR